jgi:hypothetical protein
MRAGIVMLEEMAAVRQRLDKHFPAATNTHAKIEEMLHAVFYIRSVLRPTLK